MRLHIGREKKKKKKKKGYLTSNGEETLVMFHCFDYDSSKIRIRLNIYVNVSFVRSFFPVLFFSCLIFCEFCIRLFYYSRECCIIAVVSFCYDFAESTKNKSVSRFVRNSWMDQSPLIKQQKIQIWQKHEIGTMKGTNPWHNGVGWKYVTEKCSFSVPEKSLQIQLMTQSIHKLCVIAEFWVISLMKNHVHITKPYEPHIPKRTL